MLLLLLLLCEFQNRDEEMEGRVGGGGVYRGSCGLLNVGRHTFLEGVEDVTTQLL